MSLFNLPENKPQQAEGEPTEQENVVKFNLPESNLQKLPEKAKIEEDPEGYWDWASLEGARTFLEGMSFEFSDEIGTAVSAAYFAMQDKGEGLRSWGKYYDILKKEYDERQAKFEQENPTASTVLGIGGAIANPLSYVAAPSTVAGMAGRAALEGALYGAGEAKDLESIPEKATEGALWAGSTSATLGYMFKGLSRKNISKDLESINPETGEAVFTPITLAADIEKGGESTIQGFYRDIIAPTYLAKTTIRNQEDLIINPIEKRIQNFKQNIDLIKADVNANVGLANTKFREAKEQMRESFRQNNLRIGEDITDAKDAIKANTQALRESASSGFSDYSINMNQQIQRELAGFREQVLNLSFPTNVGGKARSAKVGAIKTAKNPQEQYRLIDELWKDAGFEVVKKNTKGGDRFFPIKIDDLYGAVAKRLTADPFIKAAAGNNQARVRLIQENLGFIAEDIVKGRIKADTLMNTRNALAMRANSMTDSELGDASRAVLRTAVDAIDDAIVSKLTPKQAVQFNSDKQAWANYVRFKDAVQSKKKAGEFGMFEPSDYINVLGKQSKAKAGKGIGVLQEEAEKINSRVTKMRDSIKKNAHDVMKDAMDAQAKDLNKLRKQKMKQLEEARKESKKAFTGATAKYELELNKAQRGIETQRLQVELDEITEHLTILNAQRSQRNPSWFQSIAAVGLLGSFLVGGGAGVGVATAVGVGVPAALASRTGQKFVAGQTGLQQGIRSSMPQVLEGSRLLSRVMAEQAVQEEQPQP